MESTSNLEWISLDGTSNSPVASQTVELNTELVLESFSDLSDCSSEISSPNQYVLPTYGVQHPSSPDLPHSKLFRSVQFYSNGELKEGEQEEEVVEEGPAGDGSPEVVVEAEDVSMQEDASLQDAAAAMQEAAFLQVTTSPEASVPQAASTPYTSQTPRAASTSHPASPPLVASLQGGEEEPTAENMEGRGEEEEDRDSSVTPSGSHVSVDSAYSSQSDAASASKIQVKLHKKSLWKGFMSIGNEMVVTKPGR